MSLITRNLVGFVLALVLPIAAVFAIGLCIAAVTPTSGAVRGITAALSYLLMFFSGLYYPPFSCPVTCH
jgi:ABC-2 type transport system permease protein